MKRRGFNLLRNNISESTFFKAWRSQRCHAQSQIPYQLIMRRIDAIAIALGVFAAGGIIYIILQFVGLDSQNAGIWSQSLLVIGLLGWVLTYLFRVVTKNMTIHQQAKDYEDAVLQKRLEEMTPEEIERLQAEVEQEKLSQSANQ